MSPLSNITYKLTAMGADEKTVDCEVPVTVTSEKKVPVYELFYSYSKWFASWLGDVTLVEGSKCYYCISSIVGSVALVDSRLSVLPESSNFVLTTTDADGT